MIFLDKLRVIFHFLNDKLINQPSCPNFSVNSICLFMSSAETDDLHLDKTALKSSFLKKKT